MDYLPLGKRNGSTIFELSVSLGCADSLSRIVEERLLPDAAESDRFWFSYTLFDVVVQTDIFQDPKRPDYAPIRDNYRLKSCLDDITDFIQSNPVLSIYFCTSERIIGVIEVPLIQLLNTDSFKSCENDDNNFQKAEISDHYRFTGDETDKFALDEAILPVRVRLERSVAPISKPPTRIQTPSPQKRSVSPVEEKAPMQLSEELVFRVDQVYLASNFSELNENDQLVIELSHDYDHVSSEKARNVVLGWNANDSSETKMIPIRLECREVYSQHVVAEGMLQFDETIDMDADIELFDVEGISVGEARLEIGISTQEMAKTNTKIKTEPNILDLDHTNGPYQYLYSIDLRSIKNLSKGAEVYMKYSYPAFGKTGLTRTRVIFASKTVEALVPRSLNTFNFVMTSDVVKQILDTPIVVEVIQKDKYNESLLGILTLDLEKVLRAKLYFRCGVDKCKKTMASQAALLSHLDTHDGEINVRSIAVKTYDAYLPIYNETQELGSVRVVLSFENHGTSDAAPIESPFVEEKSEEIVAQPISPTPEIAPPAPVRVQSEPVNPTQTVHVPIIHPPATDPMIDIRREAEYKAWRLNLQKVEKKRLEELEKQWKEREVERLKIVKTSQLEYQKLESKLRHALADVESRERKLVLAEAQMKREASSKMEELQVLQRRIRTESTHNITMAERKADAMADRVKYLEDRFERSERYSKKLEEDYENYRAAQRQTPEAALKDEIAQYKGKVMELERRLEDEKRERRILNESKEKLAKQQQKLIRVLVSERKKKEKKAQDEVESLRLKYKAREEKFVLDGDRHELLSIRKELEQLRDAKMTQSIRQFDFVAKEPEQEEPQQDIGPASPIVATDPIHMASREVSRLKQERKELLATQAYDENHFIIQEIDRRLHIAEETTLQLLS